MESGRHRFPIRFGKKSCDIAEFHGEKDVDDIGPLDRLYQVSRMTFAEIEAFVLDKPLEDRNIIMRDLAIIMRRDAILPNLASNSVDFMPLLS